MWYQPDVGEIWRCIADDVHQILGAAKPDTSRYINPPNTIYQPLKYNLAINLKAEKALGLTIPPLILASADEVIE